MSFGWEPGEALKAGQDLEQSHGIQLGHGGKIAQEALFINFSHCSNTPKAVAFIKSRFVLVWLWGSREAR